MGVSQSVPMATALRKLADEIEASGGNEVQLRALLPRLNQLAEAANVQAAKGSEGTAEWGVRVKPHVTLSTQYQGEAFERSKMMKELLEQLGCTVYNPNTDTGRVDNWLDEFRKSLKKSIETQGYCSARFQHVRR